jgi:hypothetical protein
MLQAYSRLKQVLNREKLTIPELLRRIEQRGLHVNPKSLYRLSNEHQPLQRLDLRVAGAICQVCDVSLSELVDFAPEAKTLSQLPVAKQKRLDVLMAKNNEGKLTVAEQRQLRELVDEAETIMLSNARILKQQHRRLTADSKQKA